MTARPIPIALPLPRVVIALRADGRMELLADRPCRVFLTGGLLGAGHAELPPPRVGWAVVSFALEGELTATLAQAGELTAKPAGPASPDVERLARLYEGAGPLGGFAAGVDTGWDGAPRGRGERPCDTEPEPAA